VEAHRAKNARTIKDLQRSIVTSFAARALAVRRVTTNKGGNTPGVDGMKWDSPHKKMNAIKELHYLTQNPGEYKAKPVKRVFIPKPGKAEKRPLGIPTLTDRAMQAVYLYSIDPLVEETSDVNSYGFRPYRGTREAAAKIRDTLGKDYSPNWLLDADIEKCFDKINHKWLLEHVPIVDREVLDTWLRSGVETMTGTEPTGLGVPQGGVISPTLSNIALNGLERCAQECTAHMVPRRERTKVYLIRYADDFVVSGASREILDAARSGIEAFLEPRGLRLHPDKTRVLEINKGEPFTFLGFEFSKKPLNLKLNMPSRTNRTQKRLVVRPSKENVSKLKTSVKVILSSGRPISGVIKELNPILRGWSNYFRVGRQSPKVFKTMGNWIWRRMLRWAQRKHSTRNVDWIKDRYISKSKWRTNHWCDKGQPTRYLLDISTVTHMFIPTFPKDLNPYVKGDKKKLEARNQTISSNKEKNSIRKNLIKRDGGLCPVCETSIIETSEPIELHHLIGISEGGTWKLENLVLLHEACHKSVTHNEALKNKLRETYNSNTPVMSA
jgi:RNA-directed DNA polymerase